MSDWADRQDPPWTGTVPRRVRSGNNKDKMNALEEAYNKLKQQTPDVSGTRRVTKLDIICAASINTAALEEQLREARASQPELSTTGPTGAQTAKSLPTHIPCPMPNLDNTYKSPRQTMDPTRGQTTRSSLALASNFGVASSGLGGPVTHSRTRQASCLCYTDPATHRRREDKGQSTWGDKGVSMVNSGQPTGWPEPTSSHERILRPTLHSRR